MATHSGILAWRIPWTEVPGGLWSLKESDTTEQLILYIYIFFFLAALHGLWDLSSQTRD